MLGFSIGDIEFFIKTGYNFIKVVKYIFFLHFQKISNCLGIKNT